MKRHQPNEAEVEVTGRARSKRILHSGDGSDDSKRLRDSNSTDGASSSSASGRHGAETSHTGYESGVQVARAREFSNEARNSRNCVDVEHLSRTEYVADHTTVL